ncbi:uncharacterized protein LOC135399803 isoform X2 [Ornithodoros turicata]|uniref:uncharacterized protein LOC135399803 isoform X2 n=1 Tax=Ornithodoros turicata TaxID=34597 RepID=UPI003138F831
MASVLQAALLTTCVLLPILLASGYRHKVREGPGQRESCDRQLKQRNDALEMALAQIRTKVNELLKSTYVRQLSRSYAKKTFHFPYVLSHKKALVNVAKKFQGSDKHF